MTIESILGTTQIYYLIAFDANGHEFRSDPDGLMSQRVLNALTHVGKNPITDVFLMSHGWMSDVPAARKQYSRWLKAMAQCTEDLKRIQQVRPAYQPLLIGLHWPSLPWGDEEFGGSAFAFDSTSVISVEQLINQYAERLASTPEARSALTTIFTAAMDDIAPPTLPPKVREAYAVLDQETGLGSAGVGAPPGADREPFDPEEIFQAAEEEAISFGDFDFGGLLAPLRLLSFWKMKDRARQFGEKAGFEFLSNLQQVANVDSEIRFHLMGHSFGCIVVSAMLGGPGGHGRLNHPVNSVALIQGALSLWSYCSDIPDVPGQAGYFHSIIADGKITGPIITTQSEFDTSIGRWYPFGAGIRQQVAYAPGELPKYGGLGTFGIRGPSLEIVDRNMLPTDGSYQFEPGKVYNLDSSQFIRKGTQIAAHSNIAQPEVAHAVWEAIHL